MLKAILHQSQGRSGRHHVDVFGKHRDDRLQHETLRLLSRNAACDHRSEQLSDLCCSNTRNLFAVVAEKRVRIVREQEV